MLTTNTQNPPSSHILLLKNSSTAVRVDTIPSVSKSVVIPRAPFVNHPRHPSKTFSKVCFIPDPMPQADGHYKPFEDVYGTETTEEFRPSLSKKSAKSKKLPFSASVQHVRNVNLMLQCEECEMWHLLYSPRKLSPSLRNQLSALLEDFTYTCGATLSDLELPDALSDVCVCVIYNATTILRNYISQ